MMIRLRTSVTLVLSRFGADTPVQRVLVAQRILGCTAFPPRTPARAVQLPEFCAREAALLQPDGALGYCVVGGRVAARYHPSLCASRAGARDDDQDVAAADVGGSGAD